MLLIILSGMQEPWLKLNEVVIKEKEKLVFFHSIQFIVGESHVKSKTYLAVCISTTCTCVAHVSLMYIIIIISFL